MPSPLSSSAASLSAFHPSISANFSSSSPARIPSSSEKSALAYRAFFSCISDQSG